MSVKPTGKDDYGPPLGSNKVSSSINKTVYGSPWRSNKISSPISLRPSSSLSLRPSKPTKPTSTQVEIIKTLTQTSNPLISSNRYTPLHYQNILISLKDFTNKIPIPIDFPRLIPSDDHLEKPENMSILILGKTWITPNPRQTAKNLFFQDFHYLPIDINKTKTFYEFILVDTKYLIIEMMKETSSFPR